jgi:hypothetical protein
MNIEAEIKNIQSHIDKGNYHASINLAISAMNECRRNNDQPGVDTFIGVIKDIVDTLSAEFASK